MAPSSYPYEPLSLPEETRILTVLPGSLDDPLVCTLTHIPIAAASYAALSYCWGSSLSAAPPEDKFEIPAAALSNVSADDEASHEDIFYFQGRMMTSHVNRTESLYYSVGWPLPPAVIFCDGVEVVVGGELLAALRRLRSSEGKGLRIWVDALCINQGDVAEKNEHVALMGAIYAGAEMVHVWFGESVGNEDHAFEALNIVTQVFNDMLDYFVEGTQNMGKFQYKFINDERIRRLDSGALTEWLSRCWFERIWVIQEVAMAKRVTTHIGSRSFCWERLSTIISAMRSWRVDIMIQPASAPKAVCLMRDVGETVQGPKEERWSLLTFLEESRAFKSTMPCDKIYAILGMVKDDEGVVVDYALDSATIYKNFALEYMRRHESLDTLYHCVISKIPSTMDLPSWVPDWTRPGEVEPFRIRELEANAGGKLKPSLKLDADGRVLRVKGWIVNRITAVEDLKVIPSAKLRPKQDPSVRHPEAENNQAMLNFKENAQTWMRHVLDMAFPNGKQEPGAFEAIWRTFMCNKTRDNKRPTPAAGMGFEIFLAATMAQRTPAGELHERANRGREDGQDEATILEATAKGETAYAEFSGGMSKWTMNRRFFTSKGGRFGWAVDGCEPGDDIVVLCGGDYPLVVRPSPSLPNHYAIVGDCYLHGVMEGEVLEDNRAAEDVLIV